MESLSLSEDECEAPGTSRRMEEDSQRLIRLEMAVNDMRTEMRTEMRTMNRTLTELNTAMQRIVTLFEGNQGQGQVEDRAGRGSGSSGGPGEAGGPV